MHTLLQCLKCIVSNKLDNEEQLQGGKCNVLQPFLNANYICNDLYGECNV